MSFTRNNSFHLRVLTEISIKDIASLQHALQILHTKYHVPNVVISSIPLKSWLLAALPSSISPPISDEESDYLFCISSSTTPSDVTMNGTPGTYINGLNDNASPKYPYTSTVHAACVPLIPGYFSGVGDLFSALLLAHFHPDYTSSSTSTELTRQRSQSPQPSPKHRNSTTPLSYAASLALTKTHAILSKTYDHALSLPEDERQPSDDELDTKNPMRRIKRMRGRELALVQGQDIIRGIGLNAENVRWMEVWHAFWES